MLGRRWLSLLFLALVAVVWPSRASAWATTNAQTRVGVFEVAAHVVVGVASAASPGNRRAPSSAGVEIASGHPLAAKGPPPNGGNGPQHGGMVHNDAIDTEVQKLQGDDSVSNIRKNQQQVDANGNKVGTNRPDIQYDQGGVHHAVEFDTIPSNGTRHAQVIQGNDPAANVRLVTP